MQPFDLGIAFMIGCQSIANGMRSRSIPYRVEYDEETPDKFISIIDEIKKEWKPEKDIDEAYKFLDDCYEILKSKIGVLSSYGFQKVLKCLKEFGDFLHQQSMKSIDYSEELK